MRSWFGILVLVGFLITVYSNLPPRNIVEQPSDPNLPLFVSGSIHNHSVHSDGGGTLPEIAAAAKEAKLDFVVITDHNNVEGRLQGFEKAYDGVDVFVEMEVSTQVGHLLSFHSLTELRDKTVPEIQDMTWRHFLGEKTVPGLFVVIAHPSNLKSPWERLDRFTDGIEVINFDSQWRRQLSESWSNFALTLLVAPFNPFVGALRFFQPYKKDITTWDTMISLNPGSFGILAPDTHAKIKLDQDRHLRWPDYPLVFKLAANVVFLKEPLSEDFESRKRQIYSSLRQGRVAIHMQALYPFDGNDWRLRCGSEIFRSGDRVESAAKECQFEVATPQGFSYPRVIRLIRNGELVQESVHSTTPVTLPLVGPGSYRLEVWARTPLISRPIVPADVPYLFYNPIYVR